MLVLTWRNYRMYRNSKAHVARKCLMPLSEKARENIDLKDDYKGNLVEVKKGNKTIYMTPEAYKRKYERD